MAFARFDDLDAARPEVEECIATYGWAPEHSYACFVHSVEDKWSGVFFRSREGYGIFSYVSDDGREWEMLGESMAPEAARGSMVLQFLEYVSSLPQAETVYLEVAPEVRRDILKKNIPGWRVSRIRERMLWPLLSLDAYDISLSGSRMKPMRNVRSRFLREHTLRVADPLSVPAADLHGVIQRWEKNRPATHHPYSAEYHALVEDKFTGTTGARVLMVDGAAHALSAGWPIPHSDGYYHSLALHTYAYWGLGEMLMLESLEWIKKEGYRFVNLGGSDANLLAFKKKFGDVSTYTTCYFLMKRVS